MQTHVTFALFVSAHKNGYFTAELIPMETKGKKGVEPFVSDEHPRETTPDKLGKLVPVFKENGCVTAGNASVGELCVLRVESLSHSDSNSRYVTGSHICTI